MQTIGTPGLWAAFVAVVIAALAVDFLVLRSGGARRVTFRDALLWSIAWISLALVFNLGLWWWLDAHAGRAIANEVGLEFLTGYVVEKSLAVDNIFVFLMIRRYSSNFFSSCAAGALSICALAKGCGALGPSPIFSPAPSIVWPCSAEATAVSIITSAKRRVA